MADSKNLLVEIGTEELPPKALAKLSQAFTTGIRQGLEKAGLGFDDVQAFATPRRLTTLITALASAQADSQSERRGPAVAAAFDADGNPTQAANGFARSCGVEVGQLEKLETDKGQWLVFREAKKGKPTDELVPGIVETSLNALPIPKRMRWGDLDTEFVRPVHWIVLLLGTQTIPAEILGIKAGRQTFGHRFHRPDAISIDKPEDYQRLLSEQGMVVVDFNNRREMIHQQVVAKGRELGGEALIDEDLLNEVTALVEWPVAIAGSFEDRFLDIPPEVLITTMKDNQKYFPVFDTAGKLLPCFITISNIESKQPEMVSSGNERVVRPRLEDAAFFWSQDRKQKLEDRLDRLKQVVFQKKLGSVHDKAERVSKLAAHIADELGIDVTLAKRAGLLCKCDLMTDMVGEFPSLQGVMGRYYANLDGEAPEVAAALDEQYMPRFAGDALPKGAVSQAVAIADKLDTLVGIFGIGQTPTGDKDPYALRRASLGVLRIIIEESLALDLEALLQKAVQSYGSLFKAENVVPQVLEYMMERLRGYYADNQVSADVFESVYVRRPTQPMDFDRRVRAVMSFKDLPAAESLAAANKRISNILRKAGDIQLPANFDSGSLIESEEKQLADQLNQLKLQVEPLIASGDYTGALTELASLRESVDSFFDAVMVMADDENLRNNRLALLAQMQGQFLAIADLSHLQS